MKRLLFAFVTIIALGGAIRGTSTRLQVAHRTYAQSFQRRVIE